MAANLPEVKAYESIRDEVKTSHYENKSFEQSCKIKDNLIKKYYSKYKTVVFENSKLSFNLKKIESNISELRKTLQSLQKITSVGENAIYDVKRASLEISEKKKRMQSTSETIVKKYKEKSIQQHLACETKRLPMERKLLQNKIKVYEFKYKKNKADYMHILQSIHKLNNLRAKKAKNVIVNFAQLMVNYKYNMNHLKKLKEEIKRERVAYKQLENKKMEIFKRIQKLKNNVTDEEHLTEKMGQMFPVLKLKYNNEIPILHLPQTQSNKKHNVKPLTPTQFNSPPNNISNTQAMKACYDSKLKEISAQHEKITKNKMLNLDGILNNTYNKLYAEPLAQLSERSIQNENIVKNQPNKATHNTTIQILENVKLTEEESIKILGNIKKNAFQQIAEVKLQSNDIIIDATKFKKYDQTIQKVQMQNAISESKSIEDDIQMEDSNRNIDCSSTIKKISQDPTDIKDCYKEQGHETDILKKKSQENNENMSQVSQVSSEDVIANIQKQFTKYKSIQSPEFVFGSKNKLPLRPSENLKKDEAVAESAKDDSEIREGMGQIFSNVEIEPAGKKQKLDDDSINMDKTKFCGQTFDDGDANKIMMVTPNPNKEFKYSSSQEKDSINVSLNQSVPNTATHKEYTSSYFLNKINELRSPDYENTMESEYGEESSFPSYTQTRKYLNERSFMMSPKPDFAEPEEKNANTEIANNEKKFSFQYDAGDAMNKSPFQLFSANVADTDNKDDKSGVFNFLFNKKDKTKSSFFNLFN